MKQNPITFFREANEARQALVKKSMKKAQDGIETENDMMVNKPGSTGGYKKPSNVDIWNNTNKANILNARSAAVKLPSRNNQLENYDISPYNQSREVLHKAYMDAVTNKPESYTQMINSLNARSAASQGEAARGVANMMSTVRKRGGAVKTKKRK